MTSEHLHVADLSLEHHVVLKIGPYSHERASTDKHLTSLPKNMEVLFQMFPHLTTKEHPSHVYSDLMKYSTKFFTSDMYST